MANYSTALILLHWLVDSVSINAFENTANINKERQRLFALSENSSIF